MRNAYILSWSMRNREIYIKFHSYRLDYNVLVNKVIKGIEEVFFGEIDLEIRLIVMQGGLALAF